MLMLRGPSQHGKLHAEVVMLPGWAFIDYTAIALFAFERHELLIRAPTFPAIDDHLNVTVTQLCQQKFKQEGAADIVDGDCAFS